MPQPHVLYDAPVYRPLGDLALCVEFGDEVDLRQNFLVIGLDLSLRADPIEGVTETVPTHRSLGIVYDPFVVRRERLVDAVRERVDGLDELDQLPSRLVTLPIWYDDPWSRECARAHGVQDNMQFLAELNDTTVAEVIRRHAGVEHWLAAVGFQPATYQAIPLEPMQLTAPKYERPRRWTDERTLCLAGVITSFYPVRSPGGYQLLGRTPVELYDPLQRNEVFADGPVLPRVSDRHRYVPIDGEAYEEIRRRVEEGTYEYELEEGVYRLADYRA